MIRITTTKDNAPSADYRLSSRDVGCWHLDKPPFYFPYQLDPQWPTGPETEELTRVGEQIMAGGAWEGVTTDGFKWVAEVMPATTLDAASNHASCPLATKALSHLAGAERSMAHAASIGSWLSNSLEGEACGRAVSSSCADHRAAMAILKRPA